MTVAIVAMSVGVSLLVGMMIMFFWSCMRSWMNPTVDDPEKLRWLLLRLDFQEFVIQDITTFTNITTIINTTIIHARNTDTWCMFVFFSGRNSVASPATQHLQLPFTSHLPTRQPTVQLYSLLGIWSTMVRTVEQL